MIIIRHIVLTVRMHDVLMSVLVDARDEHPDDIDVRKLQNICKAARIERRNGERKLVVSQTGAEP